MWKQQLLAGDVDIALGEQAGRVLGRMHEATARDTALVERFRDHAVFVQLRVDPFYRRVQERCPDVAAAVAPLVLRNVRLFTSRQSCRLEHHPRSEPPDYTLGWLPLGLRSASL